MAAAVADMHRIKTSVYRMWFYSRQFKLFLPAPMQFCFDQQRLVSNAKLYKTGKDYKVVALNNSAGIVNVILVFYNNPVLNPQ